jgi:hypothetical protein
MTNRSYDAKNPGPPGIYRITERSIVGHRKWDGEAWYFTEAKENIARAVDADERHETIEHMRTYFDMNRYLEVYYVADMAGYLVTSQEARRIGDPPWCDSFEAIQLDLFS